MRNFKRIQVILPWKLFIMNLIVLIEKSINSYLKWNLKSPKFQSSKEIYLKNLKKSNNRSKVMPLSINTIIMVKNIDFKYDSKS